VVSVSLFNSYGEKVADLFAGSVESSQTIEFSAKSLSAGVYVYKMTTSNGETVARQVVVTR
jgi:hypothetical protein